MSKVHIDWDDNSQQTVDLSGGTINLSHSYSIADQYTITMSGRTTEISTMVLSGNSISGITGLDQTGLTITSLNLNYNDFTTLPLINNNLKDLYLDYSISGATSTIPNYSSSTLETLHIKGNKLTTYTSSILPDTMHEFIADDNTVSTEGITNIVSEMHNNSSSKTGMTISLINNYYPLIDTTNKYDLIDYSGATVKTTGRFQLEVIKNAAYQETRAYQVTLQKIVTDHPINIHVDWDDGNINDYVFAATGTSMDLTKLYSSGATGMTYYPKIDAYFDDITYLQVQRTHNFTTGATISVKEFPNLKTLSLPYNDSIYLHCKWVGTIDLSRNNQLELLTIYSHGFTNIIYPNDVSHIKQLNTSYCPIQVSPRVDKMSSLIYLYCSSCSFIGEMYSPSGNSNLSNFTMSVNPSLTAGPIPNFTNCTGLTYINIDNTNRNSIGDTIWSTLTQLNALYISRNNITGDIPDFSNCNNLSILTLFSCAFTSIGNTDWSTLPSLRTLTLSYNFNLSTTAPILSNSPMLNHIDYNNCNLYGGFPDFSYNPNLYSINFSSNDFNHWNTVLISKSLSDDKILIAGYFRYYSGVTCENILKLNSDGTPDTNFKGGFTNIDYKNIDTFDTQSDGSIIIGGIFNSYSGTTANYIKGLTADGSLNSGFTNGSGFNNTVFTIKTQSDDKVLVGGAFTIYSGYTDIRYLIRLNSDGSLDTEFLTGNTFNGYVNTIKVQSDGKILAGGSFSSFFGTAANRIIRLNSDGTKDTSFATSSIITSGNIYDMDIQSDGKIIVGGEFNDNLGRIARFNSDGTLDNTFVTGSGFNKKVRCVKILSDGKILCAGYFSTYSGTTVNGIVRLNSNGNIDDTFITGCGFNYSDHLTTYRTEHIAVDNNNKLIISGEFTSYSGNTASKLIRLNSDGSIDDTFINGANVLTPDFSNNTGITDLRLDKCGIADYHSSFYGLSKLNTLYLPNNNLSKYPIISNFPLLSTITLSTNNISGDIGDTFITNTALTHINMTNNNITGNIPIYFSGFTNLYNLYLSNNNMSGMLPESVMTNTAIRIISIDSNNFTSGLTYLSGRTNLVSLTVTNNNFSGTTMFDMSAWNNSTLYSLQLLYCNLSGILSGWYACAHNTKPNIIDFSHNYFTGNIPPILICDPTAYYYANFNNNYFTGYTQMTESICYIKTFDASYNYLSDEEINKLIADVKKTANKDGSLYINGPNMGKPTSQGLTDIAYLQTTMNWTVTYNI